MNPPTDELTVLSGGGQAGLEEQVRASVDPNSSQGEEQSPML